MTINGLAYSPDGRRLYAAGAGMGGVKVFDPGREPGGRAISGWLDQLGALTFDREGQRFLGIAWEHGQLAAADPVDGSVTREHLLPVSDARRWPRGDFAFSPDGRWVAAPTRRDGTVVGVWDVVFGRPITTLRGSAGPVTAVAFRPDGRSLTTAAVGPAGRATVTLWRLDSGRAIQTFESESGAVEALAFSGDGRKLAAGGGRKDGPGRVIVWDTKTRDVLGALDTGGGVRFVAFHPDGARLAVADFGKTKIHLWDLAGGRSITSPGPSAVSCVGFTPDGSRIAARPNAPALDGFLLALARHHLGRVDEARSNCGRALERLGSDLADEATHDVAVEALMTIRGPSVNEAESLLLDRVFPAEPFGRPDPL